MMERGSVRVRTDLVRDHAIVVKEIRAIEVIVIPVVDDVRDHDVRDRDADPVDDHAAYPGAARERAAIRGANRRRSQRTRKGKRASVVAMI